MKLAKFEHAWARVLLDTIFPGPERGELPVGVASLDIAGFLDDTMANVPFESALGLRFTLWMTALAPIVILKRLVTLGGLPVEERERVLERVMKSPIYPVRQTVLMFKAIGAMLYFSHRPVRDLIFSGGPQPAPATSLVTLRAKPSLAKTEGSEPKHGPHEKHEESRHVA
jgi:hypothetical protein